MSNTGITNAMYTFSSKAKMLCYILIAIGVISIAVSFATGYEQTWPNLLHGNFFCMAMALGATFFVALQYVAEVGWSVAIRRVPEAMSQWMPYAGVFMIIIFIFGHHHLYQWTHHELYDKKSPEYDEILDGKSGFLNIPFFVIRMVAYFLIWAFFAMKLRKLSVQLDSNYDESIYKKLVRNSAIFLPLFAVTESLMAWDFLMSIDSHWFSTLYGWYNFAALWISTLTMIALLTIYLKKKNLMDHVNGSHIQDIGKFMFAFSIFWTYLWFAQFMLIWYANLPEEIVYFKTRQDHFRILFIANFLINFIIPFLVLMTRDAKRRLTVLMIMGGILIIGHWIDYYMMIMPGTMFDHAQLGWREIGTSLGFLGGFLYVTLNKLSQASLAPATDPLYEESLHHAI